jgi:hypothetical protein
MAVECEEMLDSLDFAWKDIFMGERENNSQKKLQNEKDYTNYFSKAN